VYLQSLEIHGFKSFAKKTKFLFNDGISAIVGPNGCGKSNIVDAIRWVLGEQRAGVIRSERMENVIFNGSKSTRPLGMAEVSLTIQNTKNILPIEYSEVVVTRRLFRSLESQYLINNSPCRLKDIQDLFMDTGMGPDAYSIIELSMVETILNGRAEERRRILEEAAGVTKYKMRRKAAFRKLEATEADLVRVNDIISEIEKSVSSLQRQVQKAQRYQETKDSLHQKEIELATHEFSKIKNELAPLVEKLGKAQDTRVALTTRYDEQEAEIEGERANLLTIEKELSERQKALNELSLKIQKKEEEILVDRERRNALEASKTRLERDKEEINLRVKKNQQEILEIKENLQQLFEKIQLAENDYTEKNADLKATELGIQEKNDQLKGFEHQRLHAVESLTDQKKEEERIKTQLENIQQRITAVNRELEENQLLEKIRQGKMADLAKKKSQNDLQLAKINDGHKSVEKNLQSLGEQKEKIKEKILDRKSRLQTLKERIDLLKKFIESYEDHPEGVQHLLLQGHLNGGCKGTLAENLNVQSYYRRAVETAIGEAAVSVIVEETNQALECIEILKADDKGAVTFLPLDRFTKQLQQRSDLENIDFKKFDGVIDWAYNLVECDIQYRLLVKALLNEYLIVQDLTTAKQYAEKYPDEKLNFITLNGEIVSTWGLIRGGANGTTESGIVGRKAFVEELGVNLQKDFSRLDEEENQRKKIETDYDLVFQKENELAKQISDLESSIIELQVELAQLTFESKKESETRERFLKEIEDQKSNQAALESQFGNISPALNELVDNKSQYEAKLQVITKELEGLENRVRDSRAVTQDSRVTLVDLKGEERRLQDNIAKLYEIGKELQDTSVRIAEELTSTAVEMTELEKRNAKNKEIIVEELEKHHHLKAGVDDLEQKFSHAKESLEEKDKAVKKIRDEKEQGSETLHALELRISELKMQCEKIKDRIKEEYNVQIKEQPIDEEVDTEPLDEEIEKLKSKIDSMGPVNLLALKEFEKEKSRLEFLTTQRNDLIEAETNLTETITHINKTARQQFLQIFDQVKVNFEKVFADFFPSGKATLSLAPNQDALEADIVIEADPKGLRISALSLLSGGEKTLTAISLLFAIYLVKPSPFCILDEVDAPLDDANIGRYVGAIRNFSNNTQFIVVTHNKLTMQASDCLYGVTMEDEGISKVVSVNFQAA